MEEKTQKKKTHTIGDHPLFRQIFNSRATSSIAARPSQVKPQLSVQWVIQRGFSATPSFCPIIQRPRSPSGSPFTIGGTPKANFSFSKPERTIESPLLNCRYLDPQSDKAVHRPWAHPFRFLLAAFRTSTGAPGRLSVRTTDDGLPDRAIRRIRRYDADYDADKPVISIRQMLVTLTWGPETRRPKHASGKGK